MFTDDLVVVTESGSDLQKVLQVLEEYCARWNLSINVVKTKIVIFRRSPSDQCTDFQYRQIVHIMWSGASQTSPVAIWD